MKQQLLHQDLFAKTDMELLELYHNGRQDAVSVLLARYASLINHKVANYNINSGIDRDDMKQEAYMGLFNAVRTYDCNRNTGFQTYASHCIANKLKNLFASVTTNKAKMLKSAVSFDEIEDYKLLSEQKTTNPEFIFIQNENYESLLSLTQSVLSDFEREVMFLYLNGCDYRFIAAKLNSSQKSVDNALQRARRKLKAVLNNL